MTVNINVLDDNKLLDYLFFIDAGIIITTFNMATYICVQPKLAALSRD